MIATYEEDQNALDQNQIAGYQTFKQLGCLRCHQCQGTSDNVIMAALIEPACNIGQVLISLSTFECAKRWVKSTQIGPINVNNRNQTVLTHSVESVLA